MSKYFIPTAVLFGLLFLWEGASNFCAELLFVMPAPSMILKTLFERPEIFFFHTGITLSEMVGGFLLALAVAFPLAWGMALWKTARMILQPIFVFIQCIPMFTLAPIMVIWFDWSFTAIVVPTALMIFFPLTMNIYQGLVSTPPQLLNYFRIHQATPWEIFCKLQLPWSLPHIFAGFRIAAAIAGIGAIAGEWAGAQAGLGLLMLESRRATDLATTFAALFCLTFMSGTLYAISSWIEGQVTKHRFPLKAIVTFAIVMTSIFFWGFKSYQRNGEVRLILDWLPNPNHIPLYVGIDKGFFAEEGIGLQIKKMHDPGDIIPSITSKQCDLAVAYMPQTIRAMARGADILPIGVLIKEPLNGIIYRKGAGIAHPRDLTGKKIGYCVDGTQAKTLKTLLRSNAVLPAEKRNVSFDLVSTLGTQKVDAIYGGYWNIECEHLRHHGVDTDYFSLEELGVPTYYELLFIAQANSIYAETEFMTKFQRSLQKSIDYAREYPDDAFSIYLLANPDKGEHAQKWEKEAWERTLSTFSNNQEINPDVWCKFSEWLSENGLLER